jgi:uncharacterized protein (DUF58 family)
MFRMTQQALNVEAAWVKRVERWIEHKRPADAAEITLDRKRIYILPSKPGLAFGLIVAIMGLTAVNYQLSLGFLLVFMLVGVAWASMFSTFGNLHRLQLLSGKIDSVFAGELAPLSLTVRNSSKKIRYSVRLFASEFVKQALVDINPESERTLRFALKTQTRGWYAVPRMTVDTCFPIGIWRAWGRWQPDMKVLVYPEPEGGSVPLPEPVRTGGDSIGFGDGSENIAAIRPFQFGDSPRNIAWRAVAKSAGDELLSKQFDGGVTGQMRLNWDLTPAHMGTEARLSRLTRWVVDAEAAGMKYSLDLPGCHIDVDQGPAHYAECLKELALFAP